LKSSIHVSVLVDVVDGKDGDAVKAIAVYPALKQFLEKGGNMRLFLSGLSRMGRERQKHTHARRERESETNRDRGH
jgi:hypothetical protein